MIEVTNLTKYYGNKRAVNDISFTVQNNEVIGFLGPNGAGKSTTMNMLTGYISITGGSVKINGIDILENPIEAKKNIGYLPEIPPLYPEMSVKEYLSFVCEIKGVKTVSAEVMRIAEKTKVSDVINRRVGNLSKGYKQRVGFAAALAGDPQVLILDEPTVGMDPNQIIEVRELIRDLGKSHSVILSSHILSEVSEVCDRVLIIKNGEIVAEDTPQNLVRASEEKKTKQIIIRVDGADSEICAVLDKLDGAEYKKLASGEYELSIKSDSSNAGKEIFFAFADARLPIIEQRESEISLEDIFIEITGGKA